MTFARVGPHMCFEIYVHCIATGSRSGCNIAGFAQFCCVLGYNGRAVVGMACHGAMSR